MSEPQGGRVGLVEQLRDAIRKSGQSLNQLSKTSGVGSDRLSRFMTGKRDLTLAAVEKICDVLHLQLSGDPGAADVQEGPPPAPGKKPGRKRGG